MLSFGVGLRTHPNITEKARSYTLHPGLCPAVTVRWQISAPMNKVWAVTDIRSIETCLEVICRNWCLTSTETVRLIRDGEKGGGERGRLYLSLHCHHQNDFCIKMGSDESHFNVSVGSDGRSHKTVSTNHNLFEENGEPKRYRTEVLPLTSLTHNYH